MKRALRRWLVTFLVCGMVGAGPSCFAEEPGDSIKEQVVEQWSKYLDKTESVRIQYRNYQSTSSGSPRKKEGHVSIATFGRKCCFMEWRFLGDDEGNASRLDGYNSEYVFQLIESQGQEKRWLIKEPPILLSDKDAGHYKRQVVANTQSIADAASVSFGTGVAVYGLRFLVDHQDALELTFEEELGGKLKARMVFHDELEEPYTVRGDRTIVRRELEGEVLLIRDVYCFPASCKLEIRHIDSNGDVFEHDSVQKTFEYAEGPPPHVARAETHTVYRLDGKVNAETFEKVEVERWELAPELTEADFRLPAFGFPEPPFVKPKRSWVVYLAVIAACLGLIGGTVWLKRRIKQ